MNKLWIILIPVLIMLSGCEMAAEMNDMMTKMETVNADLKSELNMDAQVGWNIHNGTLTQITVIIPEKDTAGMTVQELKDLTYPIVIKHFDEDPKVFKLTVSFVFVESSSA